MRVLTYPEMRFAELGATRWTVEWWTLRKGATPNGGGDFDYDSDLISNIDTRKTREAAITLGKRKVAASFFGCAMIQQQRVDWFEEGDTVGEWVDVGSAEEISTTND